MKTTPKKKPKASRRRASWPERQLRAMHRAAPVSPPPLSAQEQSREDARRALKRANARERQIGTLTRQLQRQIVARNAGLQRLARGIQIQFGIDGLRDGPDPAAEPATT